MQSYKNRIFASHSSSRNQSTVEGLSPGSGADVGAAMFLLQSVRLGQLVQILSWLPVDVTCP